jgi:hypothetical protein
MARMVHRTGRRPPGWRGPWCFGAAQVPPPPPRMVSGFRRAFGEGQKRGQMPASGPGLASRCRDTVPAGLARAVRGLACYRTEAALSCLVIGPTSQLLSDSHLPDTPPASGALDRWRESGPNAQYGGAEGSDRCYRGVSFSMRATAARPIFKSGHY